MLRVLHVVTDMRCGGLETMLMNYYRNIDRDKIQFDFLTHREYLGDYGEEILKLGGKIYHISPLNPFRKKYKKELDEFFKTHKEYEIIHVHQDCMSSIILKIAKRNGVPVRIAHAHSSSQDRNFKYPIKLCYKRYIPKYATDLFACAQEAGEWMFGKEKFIVLNNAISTLNLTFNIEKRKMIREELGLNTKFVIGLTARFSNPKNHLFLLDIFHALTRLEPAAQLLLVGDGGLKDEIESKAEKLNLRDKIIITGIRTDVPDLLQAMDVFVMPSKYEGLSLAIVEAQAAGLPCFISDKVPIECKKTDLVQQISLSDSPEVWAKKIFAVKDWKRRNTFQEIVEAGFDIESNAKELQKFYLGVKK